MNLTVKFVPILEDSALGDIPIVLNPSPTTPAPILPHERTDHHAIGNEMEGKGKVLPIGRYQKCVQCVKATGDVNVPAGEVSWIAQLGEIDVEHPSLLVESLYGTIPTISNSTLLDRAKDGPNDPVHPDTGVPGVGRIALSGFVQPSWTESTLTFIRSSHEVSQDDRRKGEEGVEPRMIDSCEEIRLRWPQLGKVGNFRRVRL